MNQVLDSWLESWEDTDVYSWHMNVTVWNTWTYWLTTEIIRAAVSTKQQRNDIKLIWEAKSLTGATITDTMVSLIQPDEVSCSKVCNEWTSDLYKLPSQIQCLYKTHVAKLCFPFLNTKLCISPVYSTKEHQPHDKINTFLFYDKIKNKRKYLLWNLQSHLLNGAPTAQIICKQHSKKNTPLLLLIW